MGQRRLQPVRSIEERNVLVEQWLGLPGWVLKREKVVPAGEYHDILSEARLGLIRAAELWRENGGSAFKSYAIQWIRQHIQRYLIRRGYLHDPHCPYWWESRRMRLCDPQKMQELTRAVEASAAGVVILRDLLESLKEPYQGVLREWLEGHNLAEIGRRHGVSRFVAQGLQQKAVEMLRATIEETTCSATV